MFSIFGQDLINHKVDDLINYNLEVSRFAESTERGRNLLKLLKIKTNK